MTDTRVSKLVHVTLADALDEPLTHGVEFHVELSDGQRRWCFFVTAELLSQLCQQRLGLERLHMYGAPNTSFG